MRARSPDLRPFLAWLAVVYLAWAAVVLAVGPAVPAAHWPIALVMAFGSFVAGSTPMGGGAVGFPMLVLLFDQPAELGRDFSFAIQSVGMTSATIYILASRQPLERGMLRWCLLGSTVGTPLGVLLVTPRIEAATIELTYSVAVASFGVLHLWRGSAIAGRVGMLPVAPHFDRGAGLAVGVGAGATIAAITGVGIDMVLYAVLVLLCRADLRIAIPTSVVAMAYTSVIGIATKVLTGGVAPGVFEHWLAAAPVVAIGAPLGALVVRRVERRTALLAVSTLCVAQLGWMLHETAPTIGARGVAGVLVALSLSVSLLVVLYRAGEHIARGESRRRL